MASRAVRVRVMVEPEATVEDEDVIVDFAVDIAPGITVTDGLGEVTETALIVASISVDDPATSPSKVAV